MPFLDIKQLNVGNLCTHTYSIWNRTLRLWLGNVNDAVLEHLVNTLEDLPIILHTICIQLILYHVFRRRLCLLFHDNFCRNVIKSRDVLPY
jgi:hypothetical protein